MKLRDSAKSRSNVKLNSQDRANNNFDAELNKPGTIVHSDPYIHDPNTAKSCFDQLYDTLCFCLQKKNQVRPANGYKRFEPQPTTSKQNGIMGNGAPSGTKTTSEKLNLNDDKDKDKLTENDMKHVEKFEYTAKKSNSNNPNMYPAESGTVETTLNGVYRIPVEVETKESRTYGAGMAGQSKHPNAKAKENIEKLFKDSEENGKNSYSYQSESKGSHSKQGKDLNNSTVGEDWWKNDGTQNNSFSQPSQSYGNNGGSTAYPTTHEAWGKYDPYGSQKNNNDPYGSHKKSDDPYGSQQQNDDPFVSHKKNDDPYGSSKKNNDPYGSQKKNDDPYGSRKKNNDPYGSHKKNDDPYGSQKKNDDPYGSHKTSDDPFGNGKKNDVYGAEKSSQQVGDSTYKTRHGGRDETDFGTQGYPYAQSKSDRAFNNEDRQYKKHGDSNKVRQDYGMGYGDANSQGYQNKKSEYDTNFGRDPKNAEEFSDSRGGNDFRQRDETWKPTQNRFEDSDDNLGDAYSKMKTKKKSFDDNKKDQHERDPKSKGDKSDFKDSKSKGDKREKSWQNPTESRKNPSKSHEVGRGKNDASFSDDEENGGESRKYRSDSRKQTEKDGLILNPAKLKHGERDYRVSKDGKSRKDSKGAMSADSGRRKSDDPSLSKNASKSFKSVPDFDDEFTGSKASKRIEPLDSMQNEMANFPETRSNLNSYPASTSVRNRTSHITSMPQNDFMPLPTHIVNLPDEDMDFASNDSAGVEKSLSTSVSHSKSYENLTHRNGFGDRFKHNSSQQRKLSEPKSNKSSSLYPNTLQPFDSPKDALEKCLLQIESPEWEIVMQSLQGIVRLSRHHPEVLVSALHRIVSGLSKQIRSLRSQVTKAACVVSQELFEHLGKIMDPEIEELAPALLSRTCDANKFLQHDANAALDSMIDSVSPQRSATFLLMKGAKHRNAVIRTTACRLLARLCQNLGVEQIYALPRDTRDSLLNAAAKFLLEGSLDTRAYAKELFSVLAREPKFMRLMNEVVPAKTMEAVRKPLVKIVSQKY